MSTPKKPTPFGPDFNEEDFPGVALKLPIPFVGDMQVGVYAGWGDYLSLEMGLDGHRLQVYTSYVEPGLDTVTTADNTFSLDERAVRELFAASTDGERIGSLSEHEHTLVFTEDGAGTTIVLHNTTNASNGYSLTEDGLLIDNSRRFTIDGQSAVAGADDSIVSIGSILDQAVEASTEGGSIHLDVMSVNDQNGPDLVFVRMADQTIDPDVVSGDLGEGDYRELVVRDDGIATLQDFTNSHSGVAEPDGPQREIEVRVADEQGGSGREVDQPGSGQADIDSDGTGDTIPIRTVEEDMALLGKLLGDDASTAGTPVIDLPDQEATREIYGFPMDEDKGEGVEITPLDGALPEVEGGDDGDFAIVTPDDFFGAPAADAGADSQATEIVDFDKYLAGEQPDFMVAADPVADTSSIDDDTSIFGAPEWTQPDNVDWDAVRLQAAHNLLGMAGGMAGADSTLEQVGLRVVGGAALNGGGNSFDLAGSAANQAAGLATSEIAGALGAELGIDNPLAGAAIDYTVGAAVEAGIEAARSGYSAGAASFADSMSSGGALTRIGAGAAGSYLASEYGVNAQNATGSVGGQAGSAIGGAIGSWFGPVGTVIGSYAGSAIGTTVGDILGGGSKDVPPPPEASVTLGFNDYGRLSVVDNRTNDETDDISAPYTLGQAASETIETLQAGVGGQWLDPEAFAGLEIGYDGKGMYVGFPQEDDEFGRKRVVGQGEVNDRVLENGHAGDGTYDIRSYVGRAEHDDGLVYVDDGQEAVDVAVTQLLQQTLIEGGDPLAQRALLRSDLEGAEEVVAAVTLANQVSAARAAKADLEVLLADPAIVDELDKLEQGDIEEVELGPYAAIALGAQNTLAELEELRDEGRIAKAAATLGIDSDDLEIIAETLQLDEEHPDERVSRLGRAMEEQGAEALADANLEDLVLEHHANGMLTVALDGGPEVTIDWSEQNPRAAMLYLNDGTAENIAGLLKAADVEPGGGPVRIGDAFSRRHDVDDVEMATLNNDETLVAEGDADTLFIGDASDNTMIGGAGDDVFITGGGQNVVHGGGGENTVDYSRAQGPVRIDLEAGETAGSAHDELHDIQHVIGASGADNFITGNDADNRLEGGMGDDTLIVESGNNTLQVHAGDNVLIGGDGEDRLLGGSGDDELIGGSGRDFLHGGGGDNILRAGANSSGDHLLGGDGHDVLFGGSGDDYLRTAGASGIVHAGAGDNTLTSGAEYNEFHLGSGDDRVLGSAFEDVVIVAGDSGDFTIDRVSNSIRLTDETGDFGTNIISNADAIVFNDGVMGSEAIADLVAFEAWDGPSRASHVDDLAAWAPDSSAPETTVPEAGEFAGTLYGHGAPPATAADTNVERDPELAAAHAEAERSTRPDESASVPGAEPGSPVEAQDDNTRASTPLDVRLIAEDDDLRAGRGRGMVTAPSSMANAVALGAAAVLVTDNAMGGSLFRRGGDGGGAASRPGDREPTVDADVRGAVADSASPTTVDVPMDVDSAAPSTGPELDAQASEPLMPAADSSRHRSTAEPASPDGGSTVPPMGEIKPAVAEPASDTSATSSPDESDPSAIEQTAEEADRATGAREGRLDSAPFLWVHPLEFGQDLIDLDQRGDVAVRIADLPANSHIGAGGDVSEELSGEVYAVPGGHLDAVYLYRVDALDNPDALTAHDFHVDVRVLASTGVEIHAPDQGVDRITGGSGDDIFHLATADTLVDAGEGFNTVRAAVDTGIDFHVDALPGVDRLYGGSGDDVFRLRDGAMLGHAGGGFNTVELLDDAGTALDLGVTGIDLVFGSAGDDVLVNSGSAHVEMQAGGGNNVLIAGSGSDLLVGGAGNDRFDTSAGGTHVLLDVHDGDELLALDQAHATVHVDDSGVSLDAHALGIDVLHGGAGDDVFHLADDATLVDAGAGFNEVHAAHPGGVRFDIDHLPGVDRLYGGAGDDVFRIRSGDSLAHSGGGFNTVDLLGDAGTRLDLAATGVDLVLGSAGNDTLINNGSGNVEMQARAGDNVLIAGSGSDLLVGGAGNDRFDTSAGGAHVLVDVHDGDELVGLHQAHATVHMADGGVDIDAHASGIDRLYGGSGNDVFHLATDGTLVDAGAGFNTVRAAVDTGVDFHVDALPGVDRLYGGAGDDIFRLRDGDTLGHAGAGFNTVSLLGDAGTRLDLAVTGVDLVFGSAGNDTLVNSGSGNVEMQALGGDNVLIAGSGSDLLVGGSGNDRFDTSAGGVHVLQGVHDGDQLIGLDRAHATVHVDNSGVRLDAHALGIDVLHGGAGDDVFHLADDATLVHAGAGFNEVHAAHDDGVDFDIHELPGVDRLRGGAGDDTFRINDHDTLISAGDGFNTVHVAYGADHSVNQGVYFDIDELDGVDRIHGGHANDHFRIRSGDTLAHAGAGFNTVTLAGTAGATLTPAAVGVDLVFGSAGSDHIDNRGGSSSVEVQSEGTGNVLRAGEVGDLFFASAGSDTLYSGSGADHFDTGEGGDHVIRDVGKTDTFSGFSEATVTVHLGDSGVEIDAFNLGIDTIHGGAGDDTFRLGSTDTLYHAGSGTNTVIAAHDQGVDLDITELPGVSRLIGGGGSDIFRITAPEQLIATGSDANMVVAATDSGITLDLSELPAGVAWLRGGGGDDVFGITHHDQLLDAGGGSNEVHAVYPGDAPDSGGAVLDIRELPGVDRLLGGARDDMFWIRDAGELLDAGGGFNMVTAATDEGVEFDIRELEGVARVNGGAGDDTFFIESADQLGSAGAGINTVIAATDDGVDFNVREMPGVDFLVGGAGDDTFHVEHLDQIQSPGGGNNTVHTVATDGVNFDLRSLDGIVAVHGGAGDDVFHLAGNHPLVDAGGGTNTAVLHESADGQGTQVAMATLGLTVAHSSGADDHFDLAGAATQPVVVTDVHAGDTFGGGHAARAEIHLADHGVEIDGSSFGTGVELIGGAGDDTFHIADSLNVTDAGGGYNVVHYSGSGNAVVDGADMNNVHEIHAGGADQVTLRGAADRDQVLIGGSGDGQIFELTDSHASNHNVIEIRAHHADAHNATGDDTDPGFLRGGASTDTVRFSNEGIMAGGEGVTLDLTAGDAHRIERVEGSHGNDTVIIGHDHMGGQEYVDLGAGGGNTVHFVGDIWDYDIEIDPADNDLDVANPDDHWVTVRERDGDHEVQVRADEIRFNPDHPDNAAHSTHDDVSIDPTGGNGIITRDLGGVGSTPETDLFTLSMDSILSPEHVRQLDGQAVAIADVSHPDVTGLDVDWDETGIEFDFTGVTHPNLLASEDFETAFSIELRSEDGSDALVNGNVQVEWVNAPPALESVTQELFYASSIPWWDGSGIQGSGDLIGSDREDTHANLDVHGDLHYELIDQERISYVVHQSPDRDPGSLVVRHPEPERPHFPAVSEGLDRRIWDGREYVGTEPIMTFYDGNLSFWSATAGHPNDPGMHIPVLDTDEVVIRSRSDAVHAWVESTDFNVPVRVEYGADQIRIEEKVVHSLDSDGRFEVETRLNAGIVQFSVAVRDSEGAVSEYDVEIEVYNDASFQPAVLPLAMDIDGDGLAYTIRDNVALSKAADAQRMDVAWTDTGSGLLAVRAQDPDGGFDLHDVVLADHHPDARTDLEGLRLAYDSNGDGVIDHNDSAWGDMGVWLDPEGSADPDAADFVSLDEAGIQRIDLQADQTTRIHDDVVEFGRGEIHWRDGRVTEYADAAFMTRPVDTDLDTLREHAQHAPPTWSRVDVHELFGNDWEVNGNRDFDLQRWAANDADDHLDGRLLEQAQRLADVLAGPRPASAVAEEPTFSDAELFAITSTIQDHEHNAAGAA